jgi:hypothetical protein
MHLFPYPTHHRFGLAQYFVIPKSQHAKPSRGEKPRTLLIRSACFSVLTAIHLDHQLCGNTHEVQHISAERVLAPELETIELSAAQPSP